MEYTIIGIKKNGDTFEVDVEYKEEGKKQKRRFSFSVESWENESWKKAIGNRMNKIGQNMAIDKEKEKYIGKTFKAEETKGDIPSSAETKKEEQ